MTDRDQRRYDRLTRVQSSDAKMPPTLQTSEPIATPLPRPTSGTRAKCREAWNTAPIGQLFEKRRRRRHELYVIMTNKYARQPEKLRAWQTASRVARPRREKNPHP